MNPSGLLAPQFGLGMPRQGSKSRAAHVSPDPEWPPQEPDAPVVVTEDAPEPSAQQADVPDAPRFEAQFEPRAVAAGPTVIVKRRRLLEAVSPTPLPTVTSAEAVPAHREAKVFRKEVSLPPPIAVEAAPVEPIAESEPGPAAVEVVAGAPHVRRRRRPKDPLRAPTLLQHVVFEKPPTPEVPLLAEAQQPEAAPLTAEQNEVLAALDALVGQDLGSREFQQVMERLAELDAEIERYAGATELLAQMEAASAAARQADEALRDVVALAAQVCRPAPHWA